MTVFRDDDKFEVTPSIESLLGGSRGVREDRGQVGALKLAHATSLEFGIHRYPSHPDRTLILAAGLDESSGSSYHWDVIEAFRNMEADEWTTLRQELREVYKETQFRLRQRFPSGTIILHRALAKPLIDHHKRQLKFNSRYDEILVAAAAHCLAFNLELDLETDVLSGWSINCSCDTYGMVHVKAEFSIDRVLLCSDLLRRTGLESNEWLVLNPDPAGRLKVKVTEINTRPPGFETLLTECKQTFGNDPISRLKDHAPYRSLRLFEHWSALDYPINSAELSLVERVLIKFFSRR